MTDPDVNHDSHSDPPNYERDGYANGSASTNAYRESPCIFQVYFGVCKNIDDCKFSHSPKSIASRPPSVSTSPADDEVPQSPKGKSHRGQQQPCKFFSSGSCRRGNRCEYSHTKPNSSTSKSNGRNAKGKGGPNRSKGSSRPDSSKKDKKTASPLTQVAESTSIEVEETFSSARIEEVHDEIEYHDNGKEGASLDSSSSSEHPIASTSPSKESSSAQIAGESSNNNADNLVNGNHQPIFDNRHSDNSVRTKEHTKSGSQSRDDNHTFDHRGSPDTEESFRGSVKKHAGRKDDDGWEQSEGDPKDTSYNGEGVGEERTNDELDDAWFQGPEDGAQEEREPNDLPDWDQTSQEKGGKYANSDHNDGWNGVTDEDKGESVKEDPQVERNKTPERQETESTPHSHQDEEPSVATPSPPPSIGTPPSTLSTKVQPKRQPSPDQFQLPPPAGSQHQIPQTPQPTSAVEPKPQPSPVPNAPQISVMSLHWSRFADPTIAPDLPFCKAFAQNKCSTTSLEHCKWRHCLTPYEYMLLFKDPQPLQLALEKSLIRNDSPEGLDPITAPSITLHWSHFADPTCDASIAFCKPYAEHTCPHDHTCRFRHCLTLEEYTLLFKDPQPNLIATGSGVADQQQPAPPPGLARPFGSQVPTQQSVAGQPRPCVFFRKGTCRNGASCPYSHDVPFSACQNVQSQGYCNDHACTSCAPTTPAGSRKVPCQYWPQGICKNGDNCPFAHNGESGAAVKVTEVEEGNDPGNPVEENQASNGWGFNGDATGWDATGAGDWGDGENAKEESKETGTGWGDENAGAATGWGDQNNNDGWGQQNNDDGWGNNEGKGGNDKNDSNVGNNWPNSRRRWNDDSATNRKNPGPCYNFQREGKCFRGSSCRFSHDVQVDRSSHHDPRDTSRSHRSRTSPAPLVAPSPTSAVPGPTPARSTYGGRHQYDRGFIEQWVAVSAAGSEVGGPVSGSSSHRGSRGSRGRSTKGSTNRSVDHPDACQFYLVGRCGLGDTCPSSHDPAVAGTGIEVANDDQDRVGEAGEERGSMIRSSAGGGVELKVEDAGGETKGDDLNECNGPTDVEEIVANHDDANHVDNEWALGGQWDGLPVAPEGPIKKNQPCLYYGQGFCPYGENCRWLHVDIPSPENAEEGVQPPPPKDEGKVPSEASTRDAISEVGAEDHTGVDYGHPLVEKSIFGCIVTFGRDCLPEKVVTSTDSHILLLEGDVDVTEARVHDVVNKYGPIQDIVMAREQNNSGAEETTENGEQGDEDEDEEAQKKAEEVISRIRVEFKEMKDAAAAARDLGAVLADALIVEPATATSNWVKFRWPQPARAAWVYYPNITRAKAMAEKLDGASFQDRKITASFLRPDKRQKDLFAVKVERLPGSTTKEDLSDIALDAKVVTMSELTYLEDPRQILRQCDGLKNFVDIPDDPSKLYGKAFARFGSEESVLQALGMHGVKHKFLGKQELAVERVWFAHYILPTTIFKVITTEVTALHIRCEGQVHVEHSETGEYTMIYLYSLLEEDSAFTKANLSLQAICKGTIITAGETRPEWDEYFYTSSSTKVIQNLNSKNNFYIFPNASTRQIHSLGSGYDRDKGISAVKKLLQKVRGSWKEYSIHRNVIPQLLSGGLSEIQDEVGVNKISLDVIRPALIVRGGEEAVIRKIQHILNFVPLNINQDSAVPSNLLCPICELEPSTNDNNPPIELICRHVYCTTCLQHALMSAIYDRSAPVKCIGRVSSNNGLVVCGQWIPYTVVRDLLPLPVEPEYLEIAFTSFVLSNLKEYFFCPSLRCDAVYRRGEPRDTIRCPMCRAWNCLFCGSMTHDGMKCKEAQEARKALCD